ncbi:ABC transporter permease [Streptomyces sp. AV19]|uniref:ABC transporter ATP-binding protein/permease n=1 Tax=Streptomyces sp. AV19 TaxID=2793068 RepID=UPI0018FE2192|nr:ABC transporter permease [Streptomyces sp. AV19]MBH1933648.1 ABC transporter permease [Streptomyces sp. AV19]
MPSPVMLTTTAVSAVGLRKSYGDKTVLDGIDLRIPTGSVFALLGPNGAGKTTAVKILSTLITADGGQAQVAGHDIAASPDSVRAAIGVTGQFSAVDGLITGEENMLLMADLHHLPKRKGRRVAAELLERFDLTEAAKKPASTYSGGMKRRLDIAMTHLLHARRYPSLTLNLLLTPVVLLLLFVYVFGDVMSAGIGGGGADRSEYIAYLVPGILMMTIGGTVVGAAVSVSTDMAEGVIARFRTMAIHRGSVIIGHVIGSVLQSVVSVLLVGAVAMAIGFRSTDATALEWLAAFGLMVLVSLALTWIAVGMGMASPNAEAASNNALPLIVLPLISSAFVPVDAMPGWFRPIAEYQPFTPAIETLRGLLLGTEIGHNGWLAVAWCLALTALGYYWSKAQFNRDPR